MRARPLRGGDYPRARAVVDGWFGHPVGLVMHRLFFEQLGPSGVWLETGDGAPAGFLLGLVSEAEPDLAYVHMHVVDPALRGRGLGEVLYREFAGRAGARGCRRIRALAAPGREASRRFHERLGFAGRWAPDHLGPGGDRWIYERALPLDGGMGGAGDSATIARTVPRPGSQGVSRVADRSSQDERRKHRREDVDLPVRLVADDEVVDAHSVNLSEGGVLIAGADFPSASQVRVEIELAELGWHALDAEVIRRTGGGEPGEGTLAARFAEAATEGGRDAIRAFFESRLGGAEDAPRN
ncbi:MAG: GNAT family N-acetyltransferase [Thermoleophilia bacterium]